MLQCFNPQNVNVRSKLPLLTHMQMHGQPSAKSHAVQSSLAAAWRLIPAAIIIIFVVTVINHPCRPPAACPPASRLAAPLLLPLCPFRRALLAFFICVHGHPAARLEPLNLLLRKTQCANQVHS